MNENLAFHFYDTMVKNYAKSQRKNTVGTKAAYGRFMNAAIALARLQMPNPFKFEEVEDNAHARPTEPGQIVTGVLEE